MMINKPTVFILGAGASCPYGYPSGSDLRKDICENFLEEYKKYVEAVKSANLQVRNGESLEVAHEFRDAFEKSSTRSIDLFLARNPEYMRVGKTAILIGISKAEQTSSFRERVPNPQRDWYSYIFTRLTDELIRKDDYHRFGENKVAFITFNYDRSLEHFLHESLVNAFVNVKEEKLREQVGRVSIMHVFGQIAGLEWQDLGRKIKYGWDINALDVVGCVDNFKIIYEKSENPQLSEMRGVISKAERVFFLGFGYAKENLKALRIPEVMSPRAKVYGTALRSTKTEIAQVKSSVNPPYKPRLKIACPLIENMDCLALLREYL